MKRMKTHKCYPTQSGMVSDAAWEQLGAGMAGDVAQDGHQIEDPPNDGMHGQRE